MCRCVCCCVCMCVHVQVRSCVCRCLCCCADTGVVRASAALTDAACLYRARSQSYHGAKRTTTRRLTRPSIHSHCPPTQETAGDLGTHVGWRTWRGEPSSSPHVSRAHSPQPRDPSLVCCIRTPDTAVCVRASAPRACKQHFQPTWPTPSRGLRCCDDLLIHHSRPSHIVLNQAQPKVSRVGLTALHL